MEQGWAVRGPREEVRTGVRVGSWGETKHIGRLLWLQAAMLVNLNVVRHLATLQLKVSMEDQRRSLPVLPKMSYFVARATPLYKLDVASTAQGTAPLSRSTGTLWSCSWQVLLRGTAHLLMLMGCICSPLTPTVRLTLAVSPYVGPHLRAVSVSTSLL